MFRTLICLFVASLFGALVAAASPITPTTGARAVGRAQIQEPASDAGRHVVVLHTNDIHGQTLPRLATWLKDVSPPPESGGLPRLAAAIRRERRSAEANGAAVFVCDGGDWFQGTPEGQVDQGRAFLGALAEAGHDALVVGNHEFDHGLDVLLAHLEAVPLPALLANARLPSGEPLPGTSDWKIVERGGIKVAFVGLLTTTTPAITHRQTRSLLWTDPADALARVRRELEGKVDLVIPVTHIGIEYDRKLAAAHPDLPLIVGGHSHTFLRKGVRDGATLIVQSGAKASTLGRVDLWLDEDGKLLRSECRLIELLSAPDAPDRVGKVDELCGDLAMRAKKDMERVVGVLGRPLSVTRRPLANSTSGNLIADLMRERSHADIAVHNRGGIRTTLLAGPVTKRDLFMLLPFDNHVETLTMRGDAVETFFRESIENPRRRPLEFSGVRPVVRMVEGKPKLERLEIGGEPLAPDRRVRLSTNSFLAQGGDGWRILADQTDREVDRILLRELLELAFDGGVLTPRDDVRYLIE